MKFKRIGSLALASALSLSLAVPAFAEDEATDPATPANNTATVIEGTYHEEPVAVVVPPTGETIINPYGIGITVTKSDTTTKKSITGQIATKPLYIVNQSDMKLKVSATVTAAINEGSTMKLATETTKEHDGPDDADGNPTTISAATAKSAFVYLQMKQGSAVVADAVTDAATANKTFMDAAIEDCANASWSQEYDADKDLIVGVKAATKENMFTLAKATMDSNGEYVGNATAGSVAVFRLTGDAVATPKVAWEESDGFTANVVFTFVPDMS